MANILQQIVAQTREDLIRRKRDIGFNELHSLEGYENSRASFKAALQQEGFSVIAEVKKGSPSKGIIRPDFHPVNIAQSYQEGGATAISVLTDKPFFMGDIDFLLAISKRVNVPLLRKDFVVDPYQIKEARAFGASAVLIIVAITNGGQLNELLAAAKEFELDALVECYDQADFDRLDFNKVEILGVNNRNLRNFKVDVHQGISILKQAPKETILVSESGISTGEDIALLKRSGIHSVLIGEHFMRQPNPGQAVNELLLKANESRNRSMANGF